MRSMLGILIGAATAILIYALVRPYLWSGGFFLSPLERFAAYAVPVLIYLPAGLIAGLLSGRRGWLWGGLLPLVVLFAPLLLGQLASLPFLAGWLPYNSQFYSFGEWLTVNNPLFIYFIGSLMTQGQEFILVVAVFLFALEAGALGGWLGERLWGRIRDRVRLRGVE